MKALVWHGKEDVRYDTVTDPEIEDSGDAIIKVTSCAICGSDLHLYHSFIPAMLPGDVLGPRKRNVGIAMAAGWAIRDLHKRKGEPRDFSDRSGFPKGVGYSRGKAAEAVPSDYSAAPAAAQRSPVAGDATPAAKAMERPAIGGGEQARSTQTVDAEAEHA